MMAAVEATAIGAMERAGLEEAILDALQARLRVACCALADDAGISEWQALLVLLLVRSLSHGD